ncbi:MAG: hypothetical protein RL757_1160 [Bacteroidota bacterium]
MPAYFQNLDGLRFIAAFFVIIGHSQSVIIKNLDINPYVHFADKLASFGVDFFFVLSGFLISFLLFEELETTGTIHVRKFYVRRILRLWPLYFLFSFASILTASYFVQTLGLLDRPQSGYEMTQNFTYTSLFSTNFQILIGMNYPGSYTIGHFWSLSVEEQFYLIWAPLMFLFRKNVLILVYSMIGIGLITTFWEFDIYKIWYKDNAHMATYYSTYSRFLFFGLGALFAHYIQKKGVANAFYRFPRKSHNQIVQFLILAGIADYLFSPVYAPHNFERLVNAILSVLLVGAAIIPKENILNLEYPILKYLGKISFGIYVFHFLSIRLMWFALEKIEIKGTALYTYLPAGATILSIGFAAISYQFVEKWFLKQKEKFKFQ